MVELKSVKAPHLAVIDTATLAVLCRSGVPMVLLDARDGDDVERIPGAEVLDPESSEEQIGKVIDSKETLVVTYCTSIHCPLSMSLYKRLQECGYENLLEYPDGVAGWKAGGYPK